MTGESINVVILHGVTLPDGSERVVLEYCDEARIAVARIKPGQAIIHRHNIEISRTVEEIDGILAGVMLGEPRVTTMPGLGRLLAGYALAVTAKRTEQLEKAEAAGSPQN